jgi:hypothetical protein
LIICFFLLKKFRYFNVYNIYEVCSIKNHIRENYVSKNLLQKKHMVKIVIVNVR